MQAYFYGVCPNPTGSNCMVLCENVIRCWVEPFNFFILSFQANFPSALHKLCSLQSGQYEKEGTQYLMDNTPPCPKKKKDCYCNVMSVSNVSIHKGTWMLKLPAAVQAYTWALQLVCTAQWCGSWSRTMNIKLLGMHIPLLSRQLDSTWLDLEACQTEVLAK